MAVTLVRRDGRGVRATARYLGVEPSTVSRWLKRAPASGLVYEIPTRSSRPKVSPRAIDPRIVERIISLRLARRRCAMALHGQLNREGYLISLSTVKRVLQRQGLIKRRSPWKKYHLSGERPIPKAPGLLVEMDSIHLWIARCSRTYIITMIDVWSRWAYARASQRLSVHSAISAARAGLDKAPFAVSCFQTDHGSEFSGSFTKMALAKGIRHRQIRIRQPNDNAHIERFNRTIQDDLGVEFKKYRTNVPKLNLVLTDYLHYYNAERLHLGLNLQTPLEVLRSY